MALLRFNGNNLHLDVLVGVEENYTPSENIQKLSKKVNALKKKTNKFLKDTWKTESIEELMKILKDSTEDQEKWTTYLTETYAPKVEKMLKEVEKINKEICPNYGDHI